jgi:diguanylate cyclase (GGDEF)-like protein
MEFSDLNGLEIIDALWQFALVTGLSFVVLTLLASMIRFYQLSNPATLMPSEAVNSTTRFQTQVAARLGTAYRLPQPFCLLMVAGPATVDEALRSRCVASLRQVVRKTDVVLALDAGDLGMLVDGARRHLEPILARVQAAMLPAGDVRIGVATCPENGIGAQALFEAARAALPADGAGCKFAEPLPEKEVAAPAADAEPSLNEEAWLDALTGVLRPDRLERVMPKFVARYRREDSPVSMIYFDVDYLARYNDHYGRGAGDEILRGLGQLLQHQVREDDIIGRTGGDGFVVLMSCTPAEALRVAQRLSGNIKKATFPAAGFTLKVTVSGGVAGYPDHGRTAEQILDAAHAALLAAQDRGRNMSLLFDDSMREYRTFRVSTDTF